MARQDFPLINSSTLNLRLNWFAIYIQLRLKDERGWKSFENVEQARAREMVSLMLCGQSYIMVVEVISFYLLICYIVILF